MVLVLVCGGEISIREVQHQEGRKVRGSRNERRRYSREERGTLSVGELTGGVHRASNMRGSECVFVTDITVSKPILASPPKHDPARNVPYPLKRPARPQGCGQRATALMQEVH